MLLIPNTFTVISAVQMQQSCCKCVKVYLTYGDNAHSSFPSKCSQLKFTGTRSDICLTIDSLHPRSKDSSGDTRLSKMSVHPLFTR